MVSYSPTSHEGSEGILDGLGRVQVEGLDGAHMIGEGLLCFVAFLFETSDSLRGLLASSGFHVERSARSVGHDVR